MTRPSSFRPRSRTSWASWRAIVLVAPAAAALATSCGMQPAGVLSFPAQAPTTLDGQFRAFDGDLVSLGSLAQGAAVRVRARGQGVRGFMILLSDESDPLTATIAGGGPVDTDVDYVAPTPGVYLVWLQFEPTVAEADRRAAVAAERINQSPRLPDRQMILVEFEEGFLSDPGLWDPVDGTQEERLFLESITPTVQAEVVATLREAFVETPIEIVSADDVLPEEPYSILTYRRGRVPAENQFVIDAATPPVDPNHAQCQERVIFGEVLPSGTYQDLGNFDRSDRAVVNVGSFQGRGLDCRTAASNSVGDAVLALAQFGAHEIGHLLGLFHTEQSGLMNRSVTRSFFRPLSFARGQVLIERLENGVEVVDQFPSIIQDPKLYFAAIFETP